MKNTITIDEAKRYLANAQTILSENAGKDGDYYTDRKYVRTAGDVAWKGVLIALDTVFAVKKRANQRVSIEDYQAAVAKRDKKLLTFVNDGYHVLHLSMGNDGILNYSICKIGIEKAQQVIDWCEKSNATA